MTSVQAPKPEQPVTPPPATRGGLEPDAPQSTVPGSPLGPSRPKMHVLPQVRWRDSWIYRLATVASLILMLSGVASALVAYEFFQQIAGLAYQEGTESKLKENLATLKEVHRLQQKLLLERLRPMVPAQEASADEAQVRAWLRASGAVIAVEAAGLKIEPAKPEQLEEVRTSQAEAGPPIGWLDNSRLVLAGYVIEFPKGPAYEAFKSAELVSQSYLLLGVKLNDDIMPRMTRYMSVIIVASFLLLGSIVVIYARRFKRRVSDVIEGFRDWSERDASFRFADVYTGELKLITTQFNAMADEVEANRQRSLYLEKIASWQIIARKLAHEIKNPLTPIQMMVSQLKRRYKGDDEPFTRLLDDAQHIISEEVAGLRRMVDNFSNFARLPDPQPRPGDLVSLCRLAVELQKNAFAAHDWYFTCKKDKLIASVDEDLLRQVLLNLTKNAAEACGEKRSRIGLELDDAGSDVLIKVKDDGPGIAAENRERIFEAYFTTKHTGPSPGMGLGLAVCQKIVIDHEGKMTVASRPGETVFTIRLPKSNKRTSQT